MAANTRTGGEVLADALLVQGVEMAFCVAGESYLALLDALHDRRERLRLITCRQEGGAANMAEAYAKTTGRPGVVMVTRGPGACHGAIGLHTAFQDSTPMVMLIGQVARDQFDREAFQEIDYRRMFGQVTKWVAQIEDAARIPEYLARAFRTAMSGRPGPVALALPEDMLRDRVAVGDTGPYRAVRAAPGPEDMAELRAMLAGAKRPMMLVGGGGWTPEASEDIVAFAEANNLPTACSFRRLDLFDNASACFAGDLTTGSNPKLSKAVREADLLVVAGARLGEITTQGYTLLEPPAPRQRIVHVHASAEEPGSVFQPALAIQSGPGQFAAAARALEPVAGDWDGWRGARRADWLAWSEPDPSDAALDLGRCMTELRGRLGSDGIVTVDAGNFSGWPMRFLRFRKRHTFAGPTSGAMGYSVAAAVGAALANPGRTVVGFVGDGGFLMSGQELATARMYGAAPIIIVFDNGMYGTIRMHQERHHSGRHIATDLANPDFAMLARAHGLHGETVERTAEFGPAFDRARASGTAAVICLKQDPNIISTTTTIEKMRAAAAAG